MAKRLSLLALFLLANSLVFAQEHMNRFNDSTGLYRSATPPPIVKPARDFLMIQVAYNDWIKKPDSINVKGFNYMFNAYLCYDFPIKKSKLSFAAGLGISTSVEYLNQQVIRVSDTGVLGAQARFLPDTAANQRYSHYKINPTYLQAPFELRYFSNTQNRNKGFKAAIGLQIGTLLGAKTKGLHSVEGTNIKDKVDTKRYLSPWNFAATARVGWGNFSLFASYNLTNLYKENMGPVITPAALGFTITGL